MPAGALTQRRGHRLRHVPYVESDHKLMIALSVALSQRGSAGTQGSPHPGPLPGSQLPVSDDLP